MQGLVGNNKDLGFCREMMCWNFVFHSVTMCIYR